MTRKNLYELLEDVNFNVADEYAQLFAMIFSEECVDDIFYECMDMPNRTFAGFVDFKFFKDSAIRGTSTSMSGFARRIGLPQPHSENEVSFDHLLLLCEFVLAILVEGKGYFCQQDGVERQAKALHGNIIQILESTGYFIHESEDRLIVLEKNPAVMKAASIVASNTTTNALLEYTHHANKGNLGKKRAILCALANDVEPYLYSLKNGGCRVLTDNLSFLLNNMNIRHNNKSGKNANEYIRTISNDDLEHWYDKTYSLILVAVLLSDSLPTLQAVKDVRDEFFKKGK
jgi:hypothetical protein